MPKPIGDYYVLNFASLAKAQDARQRITQFLRLPSGTAWLRDDPLKRAVILSGPPTTLYLSPGALEIAGTLWIDLPTSKTIHASALPKGLNLIFGESLDLSRERGE